MSMDIQLTNLKGLLVNTAKFMQASKRSVWNSGGVGVHRERWEETLDGKLETVYAMYLSTEERNNLRGITVILEDGTIGTIHGFAIKLEEVTK